MDFKDEILKIRKTHMEDPKQTSFNLLLMGEPGCGKTFLLRTARKPTHIDSFDPQGSLGLRDFVKSGDVIVDSRFEGDDPKKPDRFELWVKEFTRRVNSGYFNNFATYCLDSATTWGMAIMNYILKKAKIPGAAPRFTHDYVPQKIEIRNWLDKALALPCDFILTGHLAQVKESDSKVVWRFATTGDGTTTIPLKFSELWVMDPRQLGTKVEYRILTKATGTHLARSRLAADGLLDAVEVPDIKAILRKVGFPDNDKQPLFTKGELSS